MRSYLENLPPVPEIAHIISSLSLCFERGSNHVHWLGTLQIIVTALDHSVRRFHNNQAWPGVAQSRFAARNALQFIDPAKGLPEHIIFTIQTFLCEHLGVRTSIEHATVLFGPDHEKYLRAYTCYAYFIYVSLWRSQILNEDNSTPRDLDLIDHLYSIEGQKLLAAESEHLPFLHGILEELSTRDPDLVARIKEASRCDRLFNPDRPTDPAVQTKVMESVMEQHRHLASIALQAYQLGVGGNKYLASKILCYVVERAMRDSFFLEYRHQYTLKPVEPSTNNTYVFRFVMAGDILDRTPHAQSSSFARSHLWARVRDMFLPYDRRCNGSRNFLSHGPIPQQLSDNFFNRAMTLITAVLAKLLGSSVNGSKLAVGLDIPLIYDNAGTLFDTLFRNMPISFGVGYKAFVGNLGRIVNFNHFYDLEQENIRIVDEVFEMLVWKIELVKREPFAAIVRDILMCGSMIVTSSRSVESDAVASIRLQMREFNSKIETKGQRYQDSAKVALQSVLESFRQAMIPNAVDLKVFCA
eukprot:TRINITY_DN15359_c0_g1_i1.p1 TRINITY_DN15359_c0_g1~~TRINITY_DN15359_c0_g1_i1.p1  ORF type:complete len:537 (+),score=-12.75 TRINITY_DN15359_c0_g1_i1:36-1613(+)